MYMMRIFSKSMAQYCKREDCPALSPNARIRGECPICEHFSVVLHIASQGKRILSIFEHGDLRDLLVAETIETGIRDKMAAILLRSLKELESRGYLRLKLTVFLSDYSLVYQINHSQKPRKRAEIIAEIQNISQYWKIPIRYNRSHNLARWYYGS